MEESCLGLDSDALLVAEDEINRWEDWARSCASRVNIDLARATYPDDPNMENKVSMIHWGRKIDFPQSTLRYCL